MLNEQQMETLEKMFPKGFIVVWKGPKGRKRLDGKPGTPYGVYIVNLEKDQGLETLYKHIENGGLQPSDN
jgi:murein L,D-transpeptidase YafK